MKGWTHVGTANGGNVYVKPLERRQYACADVGEDGKLPRSYRHIQWWAVPRNPVTNHPDMTCLLTLREAIRHAISVHVSYAKLAAEHDMLSDPPRPVGVIEATPDGYRELAWVWTDTSDEWWGNPLIHAQASRVIGREAYSYHRVMTPDIPSVVADAEVGRVAHFLNASAEQMKELETFQ